MINELGNVARTSYKLLGNHDMIRILQKFWDECGVGVRAQPMGITYSSHVDIREEQLSNVWPCLRPLIIWAVILRELQAKEVSSDRKIHTAGSCRL